MSRKALLKKLSDKDRNKINRELEIRIEPSKYARGAQPTFIYPLDVEGDNVYLPFAYAHKFKQAKRPSRSDLTKCNIKFVGQLRPEQKEVRNEAIKILNSKGNLLISCFTGFGKTLTAINLASKIGMRTMILTHRIILIKQWVKAIKRFCPNVSLQVLESGSDFEDCEFYIMNAANVPKKPRKFYRDIATVVVDEAHILMAQNFSKAMLYLFPRYVIGLSATPYRTDGLNILLDLYFGKHKIVRELYHPHVAYQLYSGFAPDVELGKNGKTNWGVVLNSQAESLARNEMIIRIIKFFRDRVFLVLTKRVVQGNYLVERLKEEKEDVTSLIGKNQEYEQSSRILVGTNSKCGIGFDHPRLDTLLLAADLENYFIQYLGRIFRRQDVEPMIIDIIDNNPILEKHAQTRRAIYIEHGGVVKNFHKSFPQTNFYAK